MSILSRKEPKEPKEYSTAYGSPPSQSSVLASSTSSKVPAVNVVRITETRKPARPAMKMSLEFRSRLVERAVAEVLPSNDGGSAPPEAVRALETYLQDITATDIVYSKIMDRVDAVRNQRRDASVSVYGREMASSPPEESLNSTKVTTRFSSIASSSITTADPSTYGRVYEGGVASEAEYNVLVKALKLLKTHLPQSPPSQAGLSALLSWISKLYRLIMVELRLKVTGGDSSPFSSSASTATPASSMGSSSIGELEAIRKTLVFLNALVLRLQRSEEPPFVTHIQVAPDPSSASVAGAKKPNSNSVLANLMSGSPPITAFEKDSLSDSSGKNEPKRTRSGKSEISARPPFVVPSLLQLKVKSATLSTVALHASSEASRPRKRLDFKSTSESDSTRGVVGSVSVALFREAPEAKPFSILKIRAPDESMAVQVVANTKKQEEKQHYQTMRKTNRLFQYKHYRLQNPLLLPRRTLNAIISAVTSPPLNPSQGQKSGYNAEDRRHASKILIKLWLDMLCSKCVAAIPIISTVFLEMISSNSGPTVLLHSLDLLFNLSVHVTLLDHVDFVPGQVQMQANSPSPATLNFIQELQDSLFKLLCEMLLVIVHKNIADRLVWFSGMNALLFFISKNGQISLNKLDALDIRVISGFLKNIDYIALPIFRHLIRLLVNRLYSKAGELDIDLLNSKLGGISFIGPNLFLIAHSPYRGNLMANHQHSQEATRNLFLVFLDFVLNSLQKSQPEVFVAECASGSTKQGKPAKGSIILSQLYAILAAVDAAEVVSMRIKYLPPPADELPGLINGPLEKGTSASPADPSQKPTEKLSDSGSQLPKQNELSSSKDKLSDPTKSSTRKQSKRPSRKMKGSGEVENEGSLPDEVDASEEEFAKLNALLGPHKLRQIYKTVNRSKFSWPLMKAVLLGIYQQCHLINKLEDEFVPVLTSLVKDENVDEKSLWLLNDLLTSTHAMERYQGFIMMCKLKQAILLAPNKFKSLLRNAIETVYLSLLSHNDVGVRMSYLRVAEYLALFLLHHGPIVSAENKGRKETTSITAKTQSVSLLNSYLSRLLIENHERAEPLLIAAHDLIMDFITVNLEADKAGTIVVSGLIYPFAPFPYRWDDDDTRYARLLSGRTAVQLDLLYKVSMNLLHFLFLHMPPRFTSHIRLELLYLIIQRCEHNKQDVEVLGGIAFFKKLLNERDPHIAFLASRYLLQHLQREKPEQFSSVVNTLLDKAIEMNNEQIVSNPYLQITSILNLRDM